MRKRNLLLNVLPDQNPSLRAEHLFTLTFCYIQFSLFFLCISFAVFIAVCPYPCSVLFEHSTYLQFMPLPCLFFDRALKIFFFRFIQFCITISHFDCWFTMHFSFLYCYCSVLQPALVFALFFLLFPYLFIGI